MKKIILGFLFLGLLYSCEKDDNNSDNNVQPNETIVVAERIEFSGNNQIPNGLNILSLEGKVQIENSPFSEPSIGNGLEILVDGNNNPIFFKRNYPNYSNQKINSESTILFLATFNSSFNSSPSSVQSQLINNILSHPIFGDLVNHLNTQNIIDLYSEYIAENLILLITDIYNIDLTINENDFQLANVIYSSTSQVVTISNPTHNYIAYGVYNNGISNTLQLVPPNSQIDLNLPNTNTEYSIKIMSGENTSTDLYGNLELEEIEAFNADMVDFMDDAFGFILGPFDSEDNCFIGALNTVYSTANLAQECSNTNGPFDSIKCAIDFGFFLYADVLEASSDCELVDLGSTSEIFDLLGEIIDTFDGSELIAEMAVKVQDYYLYNNEYEICLKSNGNGVYDCAEETIFNGVAFLSSQEEVDQFGSNNYTEINGTVYIGTFDDDQNVSDINDLSPLSSVINVFGSLEIYNNPQLMTLQGLGNINTLNNIYILNTNISNLDGLNNIDNINQLVVDSCSSLTSLDGLNSEVETLNQIQIQNNSNLNNLSGLINITSITGGLFIDNNNSLIDLTGLENLVNVGGSIFIRDNSMLASLNGLENINHIGNYFEITGNNILTDFCSLQNFLSNTDIIPYIVNNQYNPSKQDIIAGNCSN